MLDENAMNSQPARRNPNNVIKSPLATLLPFITYHEAAKLAYPPNAMPGQRDVPTPFGSMRVNEWGPVEGRKVLFVHGDATPSPIWSKIAHGLTKRGCRVMTLDLFGRGYSDAPTECKYDASLYSSQLLFAITSSPLSSTAMSWTRNEGISLVGFSLGGGICVAFASTHPELVSSIVLMAPGGLLRRVPSGYDDYYIQNPDKAAPTPTYIRETAASMLGIELGNPEVLRYVTSRSSTEPPVLDTVERDPGWKPTDLDMGRLIQWQWDYHKGIVHAIAANARDGPIQYHYGMWHKLADAFTGRTSQASSLRDSRMLVMLGSEDTIVSADEMQADILSFMPSNQVAFVRYSDGHGFVYPRSHEIVEHLAEFWQLVRPGVESW